MKHALHVEWTKLRTLASTFWLLLAAAATRCPSGGCADDPAKISLTGIYLGQLLGRPNPHSFGTGLGRRSPDDQACLAELH